MYMNIKHKKLAGAKMCQKFNLIYQIMHNNICINICDN